MAAGSEEHLPDVLALEALAPEQGDLALFGKLALLLQLLRQGVHALDAGLLVAGRHVVVLVEVDLAQQQDVLAADQVGVARDVGVEPGRRRRRRRGGGGIGAGLGCCWCRRRRRRRRRGRDEDAFGGGLED
jgi:hypothetical protein